MKNFKEIVKAIEETENTLTNLRSQVEVIEAWEPFDHLEQAAQYDWLKERGCHENGWIAHSSYDGYGTEFLCPPGTLEEFTKVFFNDEDDDE